LLDADWWRCCRALAVADRLLGTRQGAQQPQRGTKNAEDQETDFVIFVLLCGSSLLFLCVSRALRTFSVYEFVNSPGAERKRFLDRSVESFRHCNDFKLHQRGELFPKW
jgi:hypothetical protein